jgi:hypothetical protein
VQKKLAGLSRRRNVGASYPLILLVSQIRLRGDCIEMYHTPNLQPPFYPPDLAAVPPRVASGRVGARSRATANVRLERPTTGQAPGLLSLGYSRNVRHWILYVSITLDWHYNATLCRVRCHPGGVGLCLRKRGDSSSPAFSSCMTWS